MFYDSKKNWPIPCREEIYPKDTGESGGSQWIQGAYDAEVDHRIDLDGFEFYYRLAGSGRFERFGHMV